MRNLQRLTAYDLFIPASQTRPIHFFVTLRQKGLTRQGRRAGSEWLSADNFIQTFNELRKFFGIYNADLLANAFRRKRTNLTDLYPRTFGQFGLQDFIRQWKPGALLLACERHGDDGARPIIEDILAQDENWSLT